jgi:hypothetical protein
MKTTKDPSSQNLHPVPYPMTQAKGKNQKLSAKILTQKAPKSSEFRAGDDSFDTPHSSRRSFSELCDGRLITCSNPSKNSSWIFTKAQFPNVGGGERATVTELVTFLNW